MSKHLHSVVVCINNIKRDSYGYNIKFSCSLYESELTNSKKIKFLLKIRSPSHLSFHLDLLYAYYAVLFSLSNQIIQPEIPFLKSLRVVRGNIRWESKACVIKSLFTNNKQYMHIYTTPHNYTK